MNEIFLLSITTTPTEKTVTAHLSFDDAMLTLGYHIEDAAREIIRDVDRRREVGSETSFECSVSELFSITKVFLPSGYVLVKSLPKEFVLREE